MDERTVNIPQACRAAGVSRRTIYNWINANKVRFVRTAGGSIRIFERSLFRDGNVPVSGGEQPSEEPSRG